MSGIGGVVGAHGVAPTQDQIDAILAGLRRRGPDGLNAWRGGPAALAHALLASTPEAALETLPLTEPTSQCTITADARIDNRDELIAALGLADAALGDGELILRAYLRWGEKCVDRLLGDFAFAIFDPRTTSLFCARDHFGMRQLNYAHLPGQAFIFATEIEAVLSHGAVPRRLNSGRIADYLDDLEGLDLTSTFFRDVYRLPPAHCLRFDREGLAIRRYWELQPGPPLSLPSDEAYAQAFLKVFTEAVRCRLRGQRSVGAMLSGGVDSGAVVAVATRLLDQHGGGPLATFSAMDPGSKSCLETNTIEIAMTMPGLVPTRVDPRDPELLEALKGLTAAIDDPFDGNMTLIRAVYLTASRAGMKVVLDGVGSDVILHSAGPIVQSLRAGRLESALREARGESRYWKLRGPALQILLRAAWIAWVPAILRHARRGTIRIVRDAFPSSALHISRRFARSAELRSRRRAYRLYEPTPGAVHAAEHAKAIRDPHLTAARERYDRVAAAVGIEARDPFLDLRLIQFCLSLPAEQLQAGGWPKTILRRAMAGMTPDEVIWRNGKEHLGWTFTQSLFGSWPGWYEKLRANRRSLSPFVSSRFLDRLAEPQPKPSDLESMIGLSFLANWLGRNDG